MSNVLLDKYFLKQLDEWHEREVYVKLISLDFNENPRAEIQGYATGGSINVDGSSAVRRTCSLNLITTNTRVNELDWALETKFKLQIGLRNFLDDKYRKEGIAPLFNEDHSLVLDKEKKPIYRPVYEEIIWFPQGTYIITSFSSSTNAQGFSISIQGKDKMCLLDGTVGGNVFASHDFGKLEMRYEDGTIELEPILIYDIIKNAIHEYALEPYENIIINDLEDCSVELIEYRARGKDLVVYNIHNENGTYTSNIAFDGNSVFDDLKDLLPGDRVGNLELVKYVTYGDTIGYRLTDLTYPTSQDLIIAAGGTITQMLDAIIQILGEFEYFYDLEGRFVFQRKKIYYNVSWTNAITTERETYYDSVENGSANAYTFTKGILIESYNNKPDLNNIKNDYTIWGNMIAVDGDTLPVHLRCAIDDKPIYYYPLLSRAEEGKKLYATHTEVEVNGELLKADVLCDWRELIYRMALDYSKSDAKILEITQNISFETNAEKLEQLKAELIEWNNTWNTKYVAYYTDLLDFWRILYNNDSDTEWADNYYWNPNYVECRRKYHYIFVGEGKGKYTYDEKEKTYKRKDNGEYEQGDFSHDEICIVNHTAIPFWLDFCDDAYLEKYKPSNIGRRTKVINDSEVKAIFFEETPNVLFVDPLKTTPYTDSSLSYIRLNLVGGMSNYFQISTQGKSAKEALDNLLYTHSYYCESISLSCVPIYYLEPNVRISVYDETSGINGEFIIKSFSLQLAYNGSMSITATRAEDLIL